MKKMRNYFAAALVCLGAVSAAQAGTDDKAWKQYLEYSQSRPKMVATRLATSYKVPGDNGPEIGAYKSERVAAGTDQPKWVVSDKGTASDGMLKATPIDLMLAAAFAENPNDIFESAAAVDRVGIEKLGGAEWVVLQVHGKLKRWKPAVIAKVWVNAETGRPYKIEGVPEKVPFPGGKEARFSVAYEPAAGDTDALPKQVMVHYGFTIMFHSGVNDFSQELSGWKAR